MLSATWHRRLCAEYSILHINVFNSEVDVFGCRCKDEALLHFTSMTLANIYVAYSYIPMVFQKSLLQVKKLPYMHLV